MHIHNILHFMLLLKSFISRCEVVTNTVLFFGKFILHTFPKMATESEGVGTFDESEFVKIVGLVEDILVGEDFQTRQNDYFSRHWQQFADEDADRTVPLDSSERQKLSSERFNIFRTYSIEMGGFLESELRRSLGEDFKIEEFLHEVELRTKQAETLMAQGKVASSSSTTSGENIGGSSRGLQQQPELEADGEIVDLLLTLRDYGRFQELMEDYSKMMQGKTPDMDGLVSYRKISDDEADTI